MAQKRLTLFNKYKLPAAKLAHQVGVGGAEDVRLERRKITRFDDYKTNSLIRLDELQERLRNL